VRRRARSDSARSLASAARAQLFTCHTANTLSYISATRPWYSMGVTHKSAWVAVSGRVRSTFLSPHRRCLRRERSRPCSGVVTGMQARPTAPRSWARASVEGCKEWKATPATECARTFERPRRGCSNHRASGHVLVLDQQ
jgi:hypothetical protein